MITKVPFRTCILAGALALPGLAQEQTPEKSPPKQPVVEAREIEELIEQLGADSYRDRSAAEKRLLEIGKEALPRLSDAVEGSDDPEIQWRARRLAERIRSGRSERLSPSTPTERGDGRPPRPAEPFARWNDFPFDDLNRQMEELQERFLELQRRFDAGFDPGPWQGGTSQSQGFSMQVGPDGVRVELREQKEDGQTETKVLEAPDLESFRQQYPEVAQQYFGDGKGIFRFRSGLGRELAPWRGFRFAPFGRPDTAPAPEPASTAPPEGRRLGVYLGELDPAVREFLALPDGVGLLVDSVQDGSLAADLGIQKGDVLLRIGDRRIGSSADVGDALGGIDAGQKVPVEVNRKGRAVELEAQKKVGVEPSKLRERRVEKRD
jgi:hypothetical protein